MKHLSLKISFLALLSLFLLIQPAQAENLVVDGDMELDGLAEWRNYGSPSIFEKNSTTTFEGNQSMHIISAVDGNRRGGIQKIQSANTAIDLLPSTTYTFRFQYYVVTGTFSYLLGIGTSNFDFENNNQSFDAPIGQWTQFEREFTIPADTYPLKEDGSVDDFRVVFNTHNAEIFLDNVEIIAIEIPEEEPEPEEEENPENEEEIDEQDPNEEGGEEEENEVQNTPPTSSGSSGGGAHIFLLSPMASTPVQKQLIPPVTATKPNSEETFDGVGGGTTDVEEIFSCPLNVGSVYADKYTNQAFFIDADCQKIAFESQAHQQSYLAGQSPLQDELYILPYIQENFEVKLPWGIHVTINNGDLVKSTNSPKVYLFQNKELLWIPTEELFLALGYRWEQIRVLSEETLKNYQIKE